MLEDHIERDPHLLGQSGHLRAPRCKLSHASQVLGLALPLLGHRVQGPPRFVRVVPGCLYPISALFEGGAQRQLKVTKDHFQQSVPDCVVQVRTRPTKGFEHQRLNGDQKMQEGPEVPTCAEAEGVPIV